MKKLVWVDWMQMSYVLLAWTCKGMCVSGPTGLQQEPLETGHMNPSPPNSSHTYQPKCNMFPSSHCYSICHIVSPKLDFLMSQASRS